MPSTRKPNQSSTSTKVSGPQIHLASGGGTLSGMGESFTTNSFSGSATLNIPIPASPCRGFEPSINISYDSNAGNSIFGLGFSVSLSSISRRTEQKIPVYNDSDIFVLDGGQILVPINGSQSQKAINNELFNVTRYQPRFENEFERIEFWESQTNLQNAFWRVFDRNNIAYVYGYTDQARIVDPNYTSHVFSWALEAVYDAKGNAQYYNYKKENSDGVLDVIYEVNRTQNANKYPQRICYGNYTPFIPTAEGDITHITNLSWHFELVFDYGEYKVDPKNDNIYNPSQTWFPRKDPFSRYKSGFEIRTHRLCRNILMFHRFEDEFGPDPILVHSTQFIYEENPISSRLKSAQAFGWRYYGNRASGKRYVTESLPPLELKYVEFNPSKSTFESLSDKRGYPLPAFSGRGSSSFVDLYQEGVPGVLNQQGGSFSLFSPEEATSGVGPSITYNPLPDPATLPLSLTTNNPFAAFADVNADGRQELVDTKPLEAGYYSSNTDRTWSNFTSFSAFPTDYHFPKNQGLDVSGLGQADVILLQEDSTRFYTSIGYEGYSLPQTRTRLQGLPSNGIGSKTEAILFADVLGSGQQHQVRITNGRIECWPNLGYGQFGEKIELENVPYFDDFDTSRIHLADIDGSGALDLIYAYPDRVDIYINRSGNSFALTPISIRFPVNYYSLFQVSFLDVYGNGNSCLVFTDDDPSPSQWVYDFCNSQKPYLLCTITNNLGANTTITYTSSTQFYLEDKLAGTPWITSLPYPIQVVKKLVLEDKISQNTLINTFTYHHGYYDFVDCQFRGFGRIERLDLETALQGSNAHKNNNFLNDTGEFVAPSLTKTWYHTGAWDLPKSLVEYFQTEYFQGDSKAYPMPIPVFNWNQREPDVLTKIQAYTALQGEVLRSEIYGFDGETVEAVPYAVSQSNYEIKLLQSKGDLPYAIFHTFEKESIDYHYELNKEDPNVSHDFTLEIDDYGNITRSCSIHYPRRTVSVNDNPITYPDQQLILRVDCEIASYNRPVDETNSYFFGLVQETKEYEITQLGSYPVLGIYFNFDTIATQIAQAINNPSLTGPTSNLLEWNKSHYLEDSTGKIAPQLLLTNSSEAVFSDSFINKLFLDKIVAGNLENFLVAQGGYYLDDNNKYWWNPGSTINYSDASSFYTISNVQDTFYLKTTGRSGSITSYTYDKYQLFPQSVTIQGREKDILPLTSTILKFDYRTLAACQLQDANGTISEILQSPLGVVIATSYYGREYQDGSIKPVGFTPLPLNSETDWPKPSSLDDVINNDKKYLQGAATFFYYDFYNWINNNKPIYWIGLTAQEYPSSSSPNTPVGDIQMGLQFSDGFGRSIQRKQRVEPGIAFLFDSQGNPIIGPDGKIKQGNSDPRWLNSGRVRYNNKGNPFQQYEPYFTSTYYFVDNEELNTFGVSNTLFYDPINRVISVVRPKGDFKNAFFSKVEYTPWSHITYDDNDTIKDSPYYQYYITSGKGTLPPYEKDALVKAAHFYNTPTTQVLDNRGNTIQTIRTFEDGTTQSIYSSYDILSRVTWSADSRLYGSGIKNFVYTYDMLGNTLYTSSVDAKERYFLNDVLGLSIYYCDARGFIITRVYDTLQRIIQVFVQGGGSAQLNQTTEKFVYGDSLDSQGNTVYADLSGRNIRGKVCVSYDQALRKEIPYFTIQGGPITSLRQLRISYQNEANWDVSLPNNWTWQNLFDLLNAKDIDTSHNPFSNAFQYDALGRTSTTVDSDQNSVQYQYYVSGLLSQVIGLSKDSSIYAYSGNISYNARGDREQITYANAPNQVLLNINYAYDPDNFNLTNITTERLSDKVVLQNLNYYYDPTNNITHVENLVPNLPQITTSLNNVDTSSISPDLDYTYDATYRLMQSQGRAISGYSAANEEDGSYKPYFPEAGQENYSTNYTYDKEGGNNLIGIEYNVNNATRWSRSLTLAAGSNRAVELSTQVEAIIPSTDPVDKYFDENGNQITLPQSTFSSNLTWNYRNNIQSITLKENKTQYFTYDSSGQRVRVMSQSQPSLGTIQIDETIYLGRLIIRRTYQNNVVTKEFHKVRLFDNNACVAEKLSWFVGNPPSGVTSPQVRFQLSNVQESSILEVDAESIPISYEEYSPFGGTTYAWAQSLDEITLKNYRYSKEERDKDSGFYYYGARYYSPWLGRWFSPDPIGPAGGFNLYAFVGNNPVNYTDIGGLVNRGRGRGGARGGRGGGRGGVLAVRGGIGRGGGRGGARGGRGGGRGGVLAVRGGIGRGGRGGRGRGGRGRGGGVIVPRAKAPGTLTVATFNVTGTEGGNSAQILNHLTTMIQTETPDLIALQEMKNAGARPNYNAAMATSGLNAQYNEVNATEFDSTDPANAGRTGKTNTILYNTTTVNSVVFNRRVAYNIPKPTKFVSGHFTGELQRAPVGFNVTTVANYGNPPTNAFELLTVHAPLGIKQGNDFLFARQGMTDLGNNALSPASVTTPTIFALDSNLSGSTLGNALGGTFPVRTHENLDGVMATSEFTLTHTTRGGTQFGPSGSVGHNSLIADFQ